MISICINCCGLMNIHGGLPYMTINSIERKLGKCRCLKPNWHSVYSLESAFNLKDIKKLPLLTLFFHMRLNSKIKRIKLQIENEKTFNLKNMFLFIEKQRY